MPRVATGTSNKSLIERLSGQVDNAVLKQFSQRISPFKTVKRPNDYLFYATEAGALDLVDALLYMGFSPNSFKEYELPLHCAAREGHLEIVRRLLDAGAKVNALGENISTPLMDAAAAGHADLVQLLLDRGANPNIEDDQGNAAIMMAIDNNQEAVYAILKGVTKSSIAKIAEARKDKSSILMRDIDKQLHDAVDRAVGLSTRHLYLRVIKQLLESGADPNASDEAGMTPLMQCRTHRRSDIADILLEHGASVDCKDNYGTSVLDWVAYACDDEVFDRFAALANPEVIKKATRLKNKLIKSGQWAEENRQRINKQES